jgi:ATP-dependent Clp protease ATP-binding subunit ClpA
VEREYERAARMKAERLRLEGEFNQKRDQWEVDHSLDEVVDVNDIAEVIAQWTGIPVSQMMGAKPNACCRWKIACTSVLSARVKPSTPSQMRFAGRVPV